MRKKLLYPMIGFITVLLLHGIQYTWKAMRISTQWIQINQKNIFLAYGENQEYFLGLAYALAVSFTIFAILKFHEGKKRSVSSIAGGMTLTGILYVGGCFLLGCCGSPMVAVYLALFGSKFLGFTKPLVLAITVIAVIIGYLWIIKKTKETEICYNDISDTQGEG